MVVRTDRALVLQRYPWSESSLVAHVATSGHGRVHLVARGAYRPTSRFFSVLDLFDTLDLEWNQSPGRELFDLRAGDVRRRRRGILVSLPAYRAATTVLELVDMASRFGPPDAALFARTEAALDALDALANAESGNGSRPADVVLAAFELDYLEHLGFAPALVTCAACGGPAPAQARAGGDRAAFSAGAGGRLCTRCAQEARARGLRVGTLPIHALDDARLLAAGAWPADASPERIVRARDWIERFLDYHLEARPRSHRAFLSVPNRNASPTARSPHPAP